MTVSDAPAAPVPFGDPPTPASAPPAPAASARPDPLALPDITIEPAPPKPARLESLDVFRGITIAAMLLVNNPGSWSSIYSPLGHAAWHGWTPTDLIFPFFLFIVGVAIPFSLSKRQAGGRQSRLQLLGGIWTRALALVLLGLLLGAFPSGGDVVPSGYWGLTLTRIAVYVVVFAGFVALLFPWTSQRFTTICTLGVAVLLVLMFWIVIAVDRHALKSGLPESFRFGGGLLTPWQMRFPGVLQRIGVCYGVAASIALVAGWRTILLSAVVLMGIYSALMLRVPLANHVTGALEKQDNLARRIDERVFGISDARRHNYSYPDPEGLLSTLPAIASVLLGVLVGTRLRSDRTPTEKAASTLAWGVGVTCAGVLLGWWLMPINKQIWTPSFTVFTAGMAMLGLGAVFYIADVRGHRRWALPFKIYGMNAIAAFVLAGMIGRASALIEFDKPGASGQTTHIIAFAKDQVSQGVHQSAGWLSQHVAPAWQVLASPHNLSLAWALTFVLIVFVAMSVLYVFKIFIKV